MSYLQKSLFCILYNLLDFFILNQITSIFSLKLSKRKDFYIRSIFGICFFAFSFINFGGFDTILGILLHFFFLFFLSDCRIKKSIGYFIAYEIIYSILFFCCSFFDASVNIILTDNQFDTNTAYIYFQGATDNLLVYITLNVFLYAKKIKQLHALKYAVYFFTFSIASIFLLLYCSRFLFLNEQLAPTFIYVFFFIIAIVFFMSYNQQKILELLQIQLNQQIELSKYEMEEAYTEQINQSVKTLSKLRHDFKNHLIILADYAKNNRNGDILDYIQKINDTLAATKVYDTPHTLISSMLNAKNMLAAQNSVTLDVSYDFNKIFLDDVTLVTILGNLLDNAITAAAKTADGTVSFSINELDSFLEIICENNHCEHIVEKNGVLQSTKTDTAAPHGIGLQNVRGCVDALHGKFQLNYDDTIFRVEILLPNYAKKATQ